MLPYERLRSLIRSSADDRMLVEEAAECLAYFDDDPAQLVLVCRRLLSHQPTNGGLWWLCARIVGAADPAAAAREAMEVMAQDRTADRLAAVLPFPHDEPIAVLGWPECAGAALAIRSDLDVVVVRPRHGDLGLRRRLGGAARTVRMVDEAEVMAVEPTHLLVEALVTSPSTALVPAGTADVRWGVPDAELWLVAPVERILPERLLATLRRAVDDETVEVLPVAEVTWVAGPGGLDSIDRFVTRLDCPPAPELLRI